MKINKESSYRELNVAIYDKLSEISQLIRVKQATKADLEKAKKEFDTKIKSAYKNRSINNSEATKLIKQVQSF